MRAKLTIPTAAANKNNNNNNIAETVEQRRERQRRKWEELRAKTRREGPHSKDFSTYFLIESFVFCEMGKTR